MKRLITAIAALSLSAPAFAASQGYQQLTSLSATTAANLPSIPSSPGPGSVLIAVETQAIRWRDDASDPTATVGMPVAAGQTLCYGNEIARFRVISQTAGATVNVTYYAGKGCAQ